MVAKRNGIGFSEEQHPFGDAPSPTTSRETRLNARDLFGLTNRDEFEIRVLSLQYESHVAIYRLWLRRQAEGMTKKDLAEKLERDPAWVSRALAGPRNWTMRTLAEMAEALGARVELTVTANEDLPRDEGEDIYERLAREAAAEGEGGDIS